MRYFLSTRSPKMCIYLLQISLSLSSSEAANVPTVAVRFNWVEPVLGSDTAVQLFQKLPSITSLGNKLHVRK